MKDDLLKEILKSPRHAVYTQTLEEMGVTKTVIEKIYLWANANANYGKLASYIPELAKVDPIKTAIAIGGLRGNILAVGSGKNIRVSMQSVIKPFLYIYALGQGLPAESIASIEATAAPFNTDQVIQPELHKIRPGHPLNNAGAISSAGSIKDFNDFLSLMRDLTDNPDLNILEDVYKSETETNSNNRAIAYRLVTVGRFKNIKEGEKALDNFTRACSIGVTPEEVTRACLSLANGGEKDGKIIIKQDHVVRAINSMNSYGLYEHTGKISLLASGARALSCKSGVGGLTINIDPGRGAFCTYGPRLDSAGNSVFGKFALIPLNNVLAAPNAMRLSSEEIIRCLNEERKAKFKRHK
ncbi:MAG: glutaminase [Deltaproteobacteria bacterium]|nr:glutaminase [Deltaproteobacteria bacterium]